MRLKSMPGVSGRGRIGPAGSWGGRRFPLADPITYVYVVAALLVVGVLRRVAPVWLVWVLG
jgi:hypothetical protein